MAVGSDFDDELERYARPTSVAIDARWLWDRDSTCFAAIVGACASRSMLDGCGIETARYERARRLTVAIDARWLWDRDARVSA